LAALTPELESRLGTTDPKQEIDLILEMKGDIPPASEGRASSAYVDSMRSAFRADTAPVLRLIEQIGGSVVGENWLNRAVKVRVRAESVADLLHSPDITLIDVPHRITRG